MIINFFMDTTYANKIKAPSYCDTYVAHTRYFNRDYDVTEL